MCLIETAWVFEIQALSILEKKETTNLMKFLNASHANEWESYCDFVIAVCRYCYKVTVKAKCFTSVRANLKQLQHASGGWLKVFLFFFFGQIIQISCRCKFCLDTHRLTWMTSSGYKYFRLERKKDQAWKTHSACWNFEKMPPAMSQRRSGESNLSR